jgi:hypothetical protein
MIDRTNDEMRLWIRNYWPSFEAYVEHWGDDR